MTAFAERGLKVLVKTTEQAEFDFASWPVPAETQEKIARNLKAMPKSPRDSYVGDIRLREFTNLDGLDLEVAFVVGFQNGDWIVLIMGIDRPKALESHLKMLVRAGTTALSGPIQELLAGRRKRNDH